MTTKQQLPVLVGEGLQRSFGGVKAVQGVSIELFAGEVVALLGDNGAGKSTTLKMLAGAIQPDGGRLLFDNREVRMKSPRLAKELGIETVYQDLALGDTLDVVQNIFSGREMHSFGFLARRKMNRSAYQLLRELDVQIPRPTAAVRSLSGGQRQGTAIARAVGWGSRAVLLDEPTAALGLVERTHVLRLIKSLKARGIAVLLVSHSLPDVFEVADRVTILRGGRVQAAARIEELVPEDVVAMITGARGGTSNQEQSDTEHVR